MNALHCTIFPTLIHHELSEPMVREKEIDDKIESQLLKHLPRINETDISTKDTLEGLRKDRWMVKILHKLLGYAHAI